MENLNTIEKALVIVDMQRSFMEEKEGERLQVGGFGELPVPGAQEIVPVINMLTNAFRLHHFVTTTTGDRHPKGTAHISENPNFVNTWPPHAEEDTEGEELHPELIAGHGLAKHFIKGDVVAATPEEDDSYTGVLAHDENGLLLPDYLRNKNVGKVYICGLTTAEGTEDSALCADSTAIDFKKQGFDVTFIKDAVKPLNEAQYETCLRNLGAIGIKVMTAHEVKLDVINTPRMIR